MTFDRRCVRVHSQRVFFLGDANQRMQPSGVYSHKVNVSCERRLNYYRHNCTIGTFFLFETIIIIIIIVI